MRVYVCLPYDWDLLGTTYEALNLKSLILSLFYNINIYILDI